MLRTKSAAAGLSIASNALLIVLKLVAAAITGSIAILTEAIHSAIDLLASGVAFFSVRAADEPADREHPYGHEKLENLAATIADDSGISVPALGGRPGVHSARFAGPDATDQQNLDLLLSSLAGHDDRSAAYICVIAHIDAEGDERLYEGRCEGRLIDEPRGTGGFGYDPAFVPADTGPGDERTMAELGADEKHAISHRGRAARALTQWLAQQ